MELCEIIFREKFRAWALVRNWVIFEPTLVYFRMFRMYVMMAEIFVDIIMMTSNTYLPTY